VQKPSFDAAVYLCHTFCEDHAASISRMTQHTGATTFNNSTGDANNML
jgi:hypothetical protein